MGKETNVMEMIPNYSKVGFGLNSLYQLFPLMHLGFYGIPKVGLAHDGLVVSFCHLGFGLGSL